MKKLVNPLSTGGAPVYGTETFSEILTQEVWDAIEAILGSLTASDYFGVLSTDNIVLSGGIITDAGGGTYDITAGIAYFPTAGGTIARFPSVAGITPNGTFGTVYVNLSSPVTEQKTFFDSTSKDYAETYSAVIANTLAGEHVTAYPLAGSFPSLKRILVEVESRATAAYQTAVTAISDWNMNVSGTGDLTLDVVISSATVTVANFRGLDVTIVDDTGNIWDKLGIGDSSTPGNDNSGYSVVFSGATITATLAVVAGSKFDTSAYSTAVGDRGFITITYAT